MPAKAKPKVKAQAKAKAKPVKAKPVKAKPVKAKQEPKPAPKPRPAPKSTAAPKSAVVPPAPPRLLALLAEHRPQLAPLVLALRELVLKEAPGAAEHIYHGYVVGVVFTFTSPGKGFCHIAAYEQHVNLGFNKGSLLDDSRGLLAGTGKKIRHIRIESAADLKLPLRQYIREAAGWGQD